MHDRLKSALLEDAIEVALTQGRDGLGTIVTFASGNYNTIDYPGSSDERIICVKHDQKKKIWCILPYL